MNDNDPDMSNYEKEVIDFVEKLIKVQEKLIPDFRKSFEANTLLEKQREIFVSSFMRLIVTVVCNASYFAGGRSRDRCGGGVLYTNASSKE